MAVDRCSKCQGTVLALEDAFRCMNCGYELYDIPLDVLVEYQDALGKNTIGKLTGSRFHRGV